MNKFLAAVVLISSLAAHAVSATPLYTEGEPGITIKMPRGSFSALARELSPAVVNISTETEALSTDTDPAMPQLPPPFQRPQQQPGRSVGSGFVVSPDGYIVTNNHVVDRATRIVVRLPEDRKEYEATVIGVDPKTDLGLLKITPDKPLKVAMLGDSDALEVGDWVVAIGNQFQLGQTVTAGIVSATSRRLPTASPYDAFIQTDASINPGSSGGPLVNEKAQVVGVNTAIFSPGRSQVGGAGFNIGIGFSIPINLVKKIITQLKENKKVTRGVLGVIIQKIDQDLAMAMGLKSARGALVADIVPGSAAAEAGFVRKDIIISYNGQPVDEHDQLPLLVASTAVGTVVRIEVLRKGEKIELSARVKELTESVEKNIESEKSDPLGLRVSTVTAELRRRLKLDSSAGVYVESVDNGSVAERAGINKGDVIEELQGESVFTEDRYRDLLKNLRPGSPILVMVRKPEGVRFLTIKIKSKE